MTQQSYVQYHFTGYMTQEMRNDLDLYISIYCHIRLVTTFISLQGSLQCFHQPIWNNHLATHKISAKTSSGSAIVKSFQWLQQLYCNINCCRKSQGKQAKKKKEYYSFMKRNINTTCKELIWPKVATASNISTVACTIILLWRIFLFSYSGKSNIKCLIQSVFSLLVHFQSAKSQGYLNLQERNL